MTTVATTGPARWSKVPVLRATAAVTMVVVALATVLVLLAGYLVWREHHDTLARADIQAENAARLAAEHVRWLMEANLQALRRIDDAMGPDGEGLARPGVHDIYELSEFLPPGTIVMTINDRGETVLTSDPARPRLNLSDRAYFQQVKRGEKLHISTLLTERGTGRKVFMVARRIERDGSFRGAAVAVVPAEAMSSFWTTLDLGQDSTIGLVREDGWLVARHPVPERAIDLSQQMLFVDHLAQSSSGHYRSPRSPADGVARNVGYHKIPGLPLIAVAGISQDVALSRFNTRLTMLTLLGVPLLLALVTLAIWGLRTLHREERTREQLAVALDQNRLLMREIHHRVKNNLQVVSSLVQMQLESPESKAETSRRISAMAAMHELIYQSDQFDVVDLAQYVRKVTEGLRESYGTAASFSYDLDHLVVSNDAALPLAIIVSEVTSNALKHAFTDGRTGTITIRLRRASPTSALLTIHDNGIGLHGMTRRQGLGMKLLDAFSRQIDAVHSFHNDGGTSFTLSFPLSEDRPQQTTDEQQPAPLADHQSNSEAIVR